MVGGMTQSTEWFERPLAVVDVETTGLDPESDRVIEVAILKMAAGEVEERYCSLVNPGREISEEISNLTGIKQEELSQAPAFADIATEVRARLGDLGLVAYNLSFDRAFLKAELSRVGVTWEPEPCIDPLIFVREFHRGQGSKRLSSVAERLGISLDNAHRADADAEAAGRVLYAFRPELPRELEELLLLQSQWAQQQENEMANWRSRRGGGALDDGAAALTTQDRGNALGPAYLYGDDSDPVRAMFSHLPDSSSRR